MTYTRFSSTSSGAGARRLPAIAVGLALAALVASASAQDKPAERSALRVCQDPNNLPFSNLKGEGIENKIADLFGKALGLPVAYYSFPQRLAFIRNTLKFKLPGADYPCDIVIGVPVGIWAALHRNGAIDVAARLLSSYPYSPESCMTSRRCGCAAGSWPGWGWRSRYGPGA